MPVGFVKVGWNEVTRRLVATEADLLARCAEADLPFSTPALLHRGRWRDLELSVAAPLPAGVRRWHPWGELPSLAATHAVAGLADGGARASALTAGDYWASVRHRAAALGPGPGSLASPVSELVESLEAIGERTILFGAWHGDWSPWNFARDDGRFVVWDWEHGSSQAPVGFDVLHFSFQLRFIGDRRPLAESLRAAASAAGPALAALGVDDPEILARLHLLELALRYEGARSSGVGTNPRFHHDAAPLLRDAARGIAAR